MTRQVLGLTRGKWIGEPVKRVEDPRFMSGEAQFVADLSLPRMVHAAFVRSPHAHARLLRIDTERAAAMPGVIAIFTGRDLQAKPLVDLLPPLESLIKTPQPVLAEGKVRFYGESIAVVVARDRYLAEDAAEVLLADIEFEPLGAVTDVEQALSSDAPILFDDIGENVVYRRRETVGDVEAVFAAADHIVSYHVHTNRVTAAPMEGRGVVAAYERHADQLTVWLSTQSPHVDRNAIADSLGIPEQRIRVVALDVGGGFGQKQPTYPEEIVLAAIARTLARPVKWIEDRREHLMSASHAKQQTIYLQAAVRANGEILAIRGRYLGDSGGYSFNPTAGLIECSFSATGTPGVYRLRNYEHDQLAVLTNKTPTGPYRGVGWTAGQIARERLLDEIARTVGLDPAEVRRRNVISSDEFPYRNCLGMLYDSGSYAESLERALAVAGYEQFRHEQADARRQDRHLGIGISLFVEPAAFGSEVAMQMGWPLPSHDNAKVAMDPSGKVMVATGQLGHGQGHETSFAQIAADALGIELSDIRVIRGDTNSAPWGMGTYASRSAVIGGGGVSLAANDVRGKLLAFAGQMLEASPEDLDIADGKIFVAGSPQRSVRVQDVAYAAYYQPLLRPPGVDPSLESTRFYDPPATYSNGCIIATVEVDVETGKTTVLNVTFVEDCGTVINPHIVEGMMQGAVAQGIGLALLEQLSYDEDGTLRTQTYHDYLLPTAVEVAPIATAHLESPSPFTIGGIKGMGEGGLIATPAAIVNAVADALAPFGVAIHHLPLTPERVVKLVQQARAEQGGEG